MAPKMDPGRPSLFTAIHILDAVEPRAALQLQYIPVFSFYLRIQIPYRKQLNSHSVTFAFTWSMADSASSSARRLLALQRHVSPSSVTMAAYRSPVTSHVLDTSLGRPAANLRIELQSLDDDGVWRTLAVGFTNADGRVASHLVPEGTIFCAGTYRVLFDTKSYFEAQGISEYFYPDVTIAFLVKDPTQHFHVPLLINPFGFSTYRGS